MAIWTAPSIFASSFSLTGAFDVWVAAATEPPAMLSKPSSWIFTSSVSSFRRYARISVPERKTVELDESAWTAKTDEDVAIDESTMVKTFGKVSAFKARGETGGIPLTHVKALFKRGTYVSPCRVQRIQSTDPQLPIAAPSSSTSSQSPPSWSPLHRVR